jgi:hypothetical protein
MKMSDLSFSATGYRLMIETGLRSAYKFLSFDDPARDTADLVCLLRHDVDADLGAAAQMAEIEAEIGIRSTYFFMVRSPLYNLFSRSNQQLALSIVKRGHVIGLHFDQGFVPGLHWNTKDWILFEADMLARNLDVPVRVVSFHQPGAEVLEGRVDTGGLINTYSKTDLHGFHYISDSNRQWRGQDILQVFRTRSISRLHLLVHPMWWMHGDKRTTDEVWDAVIVSNFERAQEQVLATERAYGARRRFVLTRSADG